MNSICQTIILGGADDILDEISDALKERKAIINGAKIYDIKIGDIVRFNTDTRPKYLQGFEVKVLKKNKKTVVVKIPDDAWGTKRYRGGEIRVPLSLIDKVGE